MLSYSSYAKQFQKCNVLNVFLYWNQGVIDLLHLRAVFGWKRIQKIFFNKLRLDALSIPAPRDQERALPWCSTRQNWRTERVPCSLQRVEEFSQKSWLSRWTFQRYSRSLSQRPSLSWIATLNWLDGAKSASRWTSWHSKITRTVYLKRNSRDTKDSGISHWISRAKTRRCDFDQTFEAAVSFKNRLHRDEAKKLQNPWDGTLPQAILGGAGTRPKDGEAHERSIHFFVAEGFVYIW